MRSMYYLRGLLFIALFFSLTSDAQIMSGRRILLRVGSRQDVTNNIAYIEDLLQGLSAGFQNVAIAPIAARTGTANINLMMETYFDAVAKYSADKVQKKWSDVLSGCDVWTYSHARRLLSFVHDSQLAFTP